MKKFLKFSGGIVLLLILLAVVLFGVNLIAGKKPNSGQHANDKPAVAAPAVKVCKDPTVLVHYTANDAKKGSNQFGPDQDITAKDVAWKRFGQKLCFDPLFAATVVLYTDHGADVFNMTQAVQEKAQQYVTEKDEKGKSVRTTWYTDLDNWYTKVFDFGLALEETAAYDTLGMKPQGDGQMPKLIRSHQNHAAGLSLVLTLKDGKGLRWFRIKCDFQPFVPTPPQKCEPGQCGDKTAVCKTNCGGTPPCKVNCSPPPCVKDCKPKCVQPPKPGDNYKWDAKACKWVKCDVCVDKTKVNQPVQDNALAQQNGVNTGRTLGAPAAAPTNNTSATKVTTPTSGGTNSGSSTGSGTPSGGHTGGGKTTSSSGGTSHTTNESGGNNTGAITNPFGNG